MASQERKLFVDRGVFRANEAPLITRLSFTSPSENCSHLVDSFNVHVRDEIYSQLISSSHSWQNLGDILEQGMPDDVLIAEVDRYGLPLRTVLNRHTGLIRTDPFFSEEFLSTFYSNYYRTLYSNKNSVSRESVFKDQIDRGVQYYRFVRDVLERDSKVLEIGCGMGGILVPFKLNGLEVKGIDLGADFISIGNKFDLNLHVNVIDDLIAQNEKHDIVILSHILEHIPDLHNFFVKLQAILVPNGKVFIAVPGVKRIHKTYQENIHIYLQNAHCWSFTKETLTAVLHRFGFKVMAIDEDINCLCQVSSSIEGQFDLNDEAMSVLDYLKATEEKFNNRRKAKSIVERSIGAIRRRFGRFF